MDTRAPNPLCDGANYRWNAGNKPERNTGTMKEEHKPPTDLNARAIDAFRDFVTRDPELTGTWRDATLALIAEGIPADIASLLALAKGEPNAETKAPEG